MPLSVINRRNIVGMDIRKIGNYTTTEDFIFDKEFFLWIIHPTDELDFFWNAYITEHPKNENQIRDAILIIKSLQPMGQEMPQESFDKILDNVVKSNNSNRFNWKWSLKYAAGIAILVAAGSLLYFSIVTKKQFPGEVSKDSSQKGKVILADGSIREFDTDQTTINQTFSGKLTINTGTIDFNPNQSASALNQIIIPYGKRSEITLADGTHIWLNSGSQLSYPSRFKSDSREVYLSGEAFFDVKADPKKPFYVITHDIRIKVLGTSFNVSAYEEDNTVQTVLLEGKVAAGKNKIFASTINLSPGERLTYDKENSNLSKDKVDVHLYSSWVDGYLVLKNIPITEVFTQLKRFYNQKISVDEGLNEITFSGKLDLRDNLKEVLRNIAFACSVKVEENNDSFQIKRAETMK